MNVLEEKPITLAEVRGILREAKKFYKEDEQEVLYEVKKALEHANKFSKLTKTQANKLSGSLSELELNLNPEQVVKITDLLPETVDDVRAIFAKERFKYGEEEIKGILDLVDQYR